MTHKSSIKGIRDPRITELLKSARMTELLKSARSVLLDDLIHHEKGEPRVIPLGLQRRVVEEINKVLDGRVA